MEKLYRKTSLIAQLVFATGIFIVLLYMLMMYTNMAVTMVNELHESANEVSEETVASFLLGGIGIFEIMASYILNIWLLVLTALLFVFSVIGYGCYAPEHFSFMVAMEIMYCIFGTITCGVLFYLGKVGKIWAIVGALSIIYTIVNIVFVGRDIHNDKKNKLMEEQKAAENKEDSAETELEDSEEGSKSKSRGLGKRLPSSVAVKK